MIGSGNGRGERERERARARGVGAEALRWVRDLGIAVLAAVVLVNYVMAPLRVRGDSMRETLYDGMIVLTDKTYRLRTPRRGDVVVCRFPGMGERLVKRVMGLPGEKVEIRDGALYVEGERLEETYVRRPPRSEMPARRLSDGEYLVLGDNRPDSVDGRVLGALPREGIEGKVVAVVWPIGDVGKVR